MGWLSWMSVGCQDVVKHWFSSQFDLVFQLRAIFFEDFWEIIVKKIHLTSFAFFVDFVLIRVA